MAVGLSRRDRQERLRERIARDPFISDESLARAFGVSVQTIRLDRLALGIPELRERTRAVAERRMDPIRSLGPREVVGEIVDLELGQRALSLLETTEDMAFQRSGVVRSQHIFAQADSLALALCDANHALVGLANVKFKRPVRVGERLVAKATVIARRGNRLTVLVETHSAGEKVFRAKFLVFAFEEARRPAVAAR